MFTKVVLIILLVVTLNAVASTLIVETVYGSLKGLDYTTPSGYEAEIFLGIPFAAPPIGNLRFEIKPQPPSKWETTLAATTFGPSCVTHNPLIFPGKEDCLYLNIFRPKQPSLNPNGYPVLVWIHGGAYVFGSTDFYGYKNITNNFVSQDIIVVSVTYRLGPWGFFTSGDSRIPGNLGLWDLTQSLKFLNEVLPQFGGDTSKITIWGHSAGSGAVSMLTASPHSNTLFSQAIGMSGSVYAHWSSDIEVIECCKTFAKAVNCDFESSDLKQCLKDAPLEEYLAFGKNLPVFRTGGTFGYMNPLNDGDFIQTKSYDDAFAKAPKIPTLLGLTSQEGLLWSSQVLPLFVETRPFYLSPQSVKGYKREDLVAYIRHFITSEKNFGKHGLEAAEKIIEFYTQGEHSTNNKHFYFERYTQILSDLLFNTPTIREIKVKAAAGNPTYLYYYNHDLPREVTKFQIPGTAHAAEWTPLFGIYFFGGPFEFTEADKKAQQNFIDIFVTFTKAGKPKTANIEFPQSSASNLEYVEVSDKPKTGNLLFADRLAFWESIASKYGYDFSQGNILQSEKHQRNEL